MKNSGENQGAPYIMAHSGQPGLLHLALSLLAWSGLSRQGTLLTKPELHAFTMKWKQTHSNLSAMSGSQEAGLLPGMISV